MPLNRRLQSLFPEYIFNENARISINGAYDIMQSVANERGIDFENLNPSTIEDFVSVVRYAPDSLSNSQIARRTGLIPVVPHRRIVANGGGFGINNSQLRQVGSRMEGAQETAIRLTSNSDYDTFTRQIDALYRNNHHVEVMPDIPIEPSPTLDEMMNNNDDYSWVGITMPTLRTSATTQKKKRPRSEMDMVREVVRGENFPRPNFKDWSDNQELGEVFNDWYSNIEYREHWIFSRREREGFNRRNVDVFSLDDVMARLSKRKKPHVLDSSFSKFYDWKLGGTNWILRLELFQHKQLHFLIVRHIHRPTDTEIKFDVRYWSGNGHFKSLNSVWTESTNHEDKFERVFGSSNPDSPYYIPSFEEDEIDEDYDDGSRYEEEWDEGDTF